MSAALAFHLSARGWSSRLHRIARNGKETGRDVYWPRSCRPHGGVHSSQLHDLPRAGGGVGAAEMRPRPAVRGIREAEFQDYEKIARLQWRNGLGTRTRAGWSALWTNNPAYRAGAPLGWVIETPSGEIGGYLGNLPLEYRFEGRSIRAVTAYSWAADPSFRGYSLALLDRFVHQPGIDLIVCATANAPAGRAYQAFRFERVPSGNWDQCRFWITGYRGFSRSALRAAYIPLGGVLAYPVAGVARTARFCADALRRPRATDCDCEFHFAAGFDARFDRFWDDLEARERGRLLAVRTRETLAWHFGKSLERGDAWILTAARGSRVIAYMIFDRQDNAALRLRRIRIADFQTLEADGERMIHSMIGRALDHFRREGAHVVENAGCWLDRSGLAAPYRRTLKSWAFYYKARDPEILQQLRDPAKWAPTSFDGDASI
jgi:hypothetical protein